MSKKCKFMDSKFIPEDSILMTKKVTVLSNGYCHAPGWNVGIEKTKESIFVYDSLYDLWQQYSVKDNNHWKDAPKKNKPVATWYRISGKSMKN